MISDVLADAVADIDKYLTDPTFAAVYGPWRERILAVREQMDELRAALDAPPSDLGRG